MPSYEDFGSNIEAHLNYVFTLAAGEALDVLKRRFEDGSWTSAPGAWLARLRVTAHQHRLADDARIRDLRASLVGFLVAGRVEREAHETLRDLFDDHVSVTPTEAATLAKWLAEKAEPGDASLAADVATKVLLVRHDDALARAIHPLVHWLILNGSAELRSRRRLELLLPLVEAVDRLGADPFERACSLRYLIVNEGNIGSHAHFINDPHPVLRTAEHALEDDPRTMIARELAERLGASFVESVLDPRDAQPVYPHLRRALLHSLARGAWAKPLAASAWSYAFWCPCPVRGSGLAFGSSDAVDGALDGLRSHSMFADRRDRSRRGGDPTNDRAWARVVVGEFARIHELADGLGSEQRDRLARCVGLTEALTAGIADALAEVLDERAPLSRTILLEGKSHGHLAAAVTALPVQRVALEARGDVEPRDVLALLTQLINRPWMDPVVGVDLAGVLVGATRVQFTDLADDDKVCVAEGVVRLDRASAKKAMAVPMDREAILALLALYFVHELVHLQQGIGRKALVTNLRSTGAETILMHVDLGADHAAACIVTRAFPRWRLEWLKDLQGRSLAAFPVSPFNIEAGRARKAQRLIGLRLDYLARMTGSISAEVLREGYAFADFGPAGGRVLLLVSGPPMGVIASAALSSKDAALLAGAADEGLDAERLARIDGVLLAKLGPGAG